jgi:hydrogenase/urease accessory protein HupE
MGADMNTDLALVLMGCTGAIFGFLLGYAKGHEHGKIQGKINARRLIKAQSQHEFNR